MNLSPAVRLALITCSVVASAAVAGAGAARRPVQEVARQWNFDQDKPGAIALGWTNMTGTWHVVADGTAPSAPNTLAQVSNDHVGSYFNLAIADTPPLKDVTVSVRSKAEVGKIDQGGGLVWRYRDHKNYYVARHNNLEKNYRLYKVVDGTRTRFGTADLDLAAGTWHELKVTMSGNRIECWLDGKRLIEAQDDTFPEAGGVGLWSKADAQSHFDNFTVTGR
jgi:hypothetical protein